MIEQGSLLAAARQLGVSQPTLGRHVAELERQLGTVLFERTGRGLVATSAARSIADQARAMADNAEAIGRKLTGQSKQLSGSVRITASETVATYLLPPLIARFREREAGIAIDIVASNAVSNGVASFLLPKVTVGFPGNYRVPFKFPLLKQGVATPDF